MTRGGEHLPQHLLDAYVDGELVGETRGQVVEHLEACAACREAAGQAAALVARLRALPAEVMPAQDLLPAIHARLGWRSRMNRGLATLGQRPLRSLAYPLAAAALAAMALSSALTLMLLRERLEPVLATSPLPGVRSRTSDVALFQLRAVLPDYDHAAAELRAVLEGQKVGLAPATVALVEENLRVVDAAILETLAALAMDPGNRILTEMVVAAYATRLDLLRRATALEARS